MSHSCNIPYQFDTQPHTPILLSSVDPTLIDRPTDRKHHPATHRNTGRLRATGTQPRTKVGNMSLAERAKNPPTRITGTDCSVGLLLRTLDGAELAALETMLGTPECRGWSQSEIYDALKAEGHEVGRQTINRHRAKGCRCFR